MELFVQLLAATFSLAFATRAALGICFPRMRGTWEGTSVAVSPLALSGIAVFCGGIGILVLGCHLFPSVVCLALLAISLCGFVLAGIGQAIDKLSQVQGHEPADVIDDRGVSELSPGREERPAIRWQPGSLNGSCRLLQGPNGASFRFEGDRWRITAPVSNGRSAVLLVPILSIFTFLFGIAAYQMVFRPEQVRFDGDPLSFKVVFFGSIVPMLLVFWGHGLMTLGGKVVVRAKGERGLVFVGIGPFGVYRFFKTTNIRRIRFDRSRLMPEHEYGERIVLEGTQTIRFGAALRRDVRAFVLRRLREVLPHANQRRSQERKAGLSEKHREEASQ